MTVNVIVVVLRYVAVDRDDVGYTHDVRRMEPSTVYVDSATTTEETFMTVGSGTNAMVWLSTTVSYVEMGKVTVLVIESGEAGAGRL